MIYKSGEKAFIIIDGSVIDNLDTNFLEWDYPKELITNLSRPQYNKLRRKAFKALIDERLTLPLAPNQVKKNQPRFRVN